jgi:hypothetical protein
MEKLVNRRLGMIDKGLTGQPGYFMKRIYDETLITICQKYEETPANVRFYTLCIV